MPAQSSRRIDLHCHSTASDGRLSPADLCRRAASLGVEVLSITDHDTIAAYADPDLNSSTPVRLIPGIELSTQYGSTGIHVLGLNIRPGNDALVAAVKVQQEKRFARAERIAAKLEKRGIDDSLTEILKAYGNAVIGRAHFARHLVETGRVNNFQQAFKKFLGRGKSCYVPPDWIQMPDIIDAIRGAGGVAVLAHPAKYALTHAKLNALIDAFREAGGQGIEVISGHQQTETTARLTTLCLEKDLLASCGSDFHEPDQPWAELGHFPDLPAQCRPVWQTWDTA